MNQTYQLIKTADGSLSVHDNEFGVPFHSMHGALTESIHVFIHAGLDHVGVSADQVHLLEIGFGTGLNALLAAIWSRKHKIPVSYTGIEPRPVPRAVIDKLGYAQALGKPRLVETMKAIHNAREQSRIHPFFTCQVIPETLQTFQTQNRFDLVFYDAFAPNAHPEMWSLETLRHLTGLLVPGAVLVTYCAKGQFKRDLKALGYQVESLPGPPGKREMVRATLRPA